MLEKSTVKLEFANPKNGTSMIDYESAKDKMMPLLGLMLAGSYM